MTATKTKNDTASVTAAIMPVDVNKKEEPKHAPLLNPSLSDLKKAGLAGKKPTAKKAVAKEKPKTPPAPVKAETKKEKASSAPAKIPEKKEETAVTMSTDAFSKEILTELHRRTKEIKNSIIAIDYDFEKIAFNLHWINAKQAFKAEGYPTIIEYAAEHFGYQKSTCYSLIAVVDRFAEHDEKGALTESFDKRVKRFGVSKLSLMVNLTDAEIAKLKPTMSVRDIKKFVKGLQGKALPELSEGDGESSEDIGTEDSNVIDTNAVVVSDVLIKGKDDYGKKAGKIDEYIMRVFKHHPDAVIEISYSLPPKEEKKA